MNKLLASPLATDGGDRPTLAALLSNFLLYQLAWFACVLGAAAGRPALGVVAAVLVVALRLAYAARRMAELKVILLTGVLGWAWESMLVQMDWVRYRSGGVTGWPPIWIGALWLAFATTFNGCLRWLQGRPGLAALLGFAGGPLAWWAGARLGALELTDLAASLFVIGLGWAALMPLLMATAARLEAAAGRTNKPGG